LQIANQVAPKFGLSQFTQDDFNHFRTLPIHKIMKELHFPLYKVPHAISLALMEYRHLVNVLEPCAGICPMLKALCDLQVPMAMLSSNTNENLQLFLQRLQIDAFLWVEGTSGILKKSHRIKQQLNKHKLDPKQVIYVGDETRDIDAARKCGMRVIAVTWGFHNTELLSSHEPDYLVNSPAEIVKIVEYLIAQA
ncbi:MAG: HAD-IA family hydrolase, partial [Candidatus Cloacimonas sp.]|nr:HAD-IA family hydrolase [Candidatus Cloacimonas sp.]